MSLRVILGLVLAGGFCAGLFAGTLTARPPRTPQPVLDPRIETEVRYWAERFHLGPAQSDAVRRELTQYDRDVRQLLQRLRHDHQEEFAALKAAAQARLDRIVAPTDPPPAGEGEAGP